MLDHRDVAWNPPILEGGAPVDSYTVTSSKGDRAAISAADFWSKGYVRLPGLTNGGDYTFTVSAANANGSSSPSLPSRPVTPNVKAIHPPSAPVNVQALVGEGAASVHFGASEDNGGSPIVAYTITAHPSSGSGDRKVTLTGHTVLTLGGRHTMFGVVDGLQQGETYTFEVTATNAAGEGPKGAN